jgi:hypothetical protein
MYLKMKTLPSIKGIIPWTMTRPITISKIDETHFDIELFEGERVYHIHDAAGGADRWIEALNLMVQTWGAYLKSSVGNKINLKMLADSLKQPREST